ncbi:DUF1441 family protein [Cupriavidus sp. IK-TO18]|uniref:DUF1441 family protein n=1 Tax=Cupriavidus sp. IK-TO18 TaxID=2782182 RepID=UPI00189AAD98|nr:DUF1441 family protein [Cupriavidus sp. IK-TO18]MBF6987244.1 DUF1441 family protein [Cupriavidus sp. IK-TO18]
MSETTQPRATKGNGHGGARAGAGRKPKDFVKPEATVDFEEARARNESAKADLNELEFKIKSGEYVARVAVVQATATAYAAIAQTLRSLPDHLERRLALAPEVAEEIGRQIDEALGELAGVLEKMRGENA